MQVHVAVCSDRFPLTPLDAKGFVMTQPVILVTGATGKTGSAVVNQLLEQGHRVRAVVRRHDGRSESLRQAGAEIVIADLFDPEQLLGAMRGTQHAYYCPPFHPFMIQSAAAFAVAARQARLESVVALTQWLASPSHPSLSTRQHFLADQLFAMLPGIACTTVAPGFFASYPYLELIDYASLLGIYPMPLDGQSRNAPPSDEDIARVAVAALMDPAKHAGKIYRPTGPEMLSVQEMAGIMGHVVGHKVRHIRVPMWMFLKAARMGGIDPFLLSQFPAYMADQDSGAFAHGGVTDHVLEVTGQPPEDFETITRRYAAQPKARRTIGNTLRAFGAFMTVPLRPGLNPARYERQQNFPMPSAPREAMQDEQWRAQRAKTAASAKVTSLKLAASA
jgi:uncharacterized protein YbjT (DUF2867 family)